MAESVLDELALACEALLRHIADATRGGDLASPDDPFDLALRETYRAAKRLNSQLRNLGTQRTERFLRLHSPSEKGLERGGTLLRGSAATLSIPALLGTLEVQRMSGLLEVTLPGEGIQLAILEGRLIGARTNRPRPGQRIGELLASFPGVEPKLLDKVLGRERRDDVLGRILWREGIVPHATLLAALERQAQEIVLRLVQADKAYFAFHRRALDSPVDRFSLSLTRLVLESARKIDEHADCRA